MAKPLPTAIFMNPIDFAKLQKAAMSDETKDLPRWVFPISSLGIPIHVDPYVPAGTPWFWPPESAPDTIRCTEHDDCKQNPAMGRACYLDQQARQRQSAEPEKGNGT